MDGLDAVVEAYRAQSERRAAQLRRLAQSSLTSTLVVLGLTGLLVLRPMVSRVRHDMAALQDLNETDVQKAHDRLHRLFEDLRGYVSPRKMEKRLSQLYDVFQEAWTTIAPLRAGRDVTLVQSSENIAPLCWIDPFQMEQVFRNILENALAACEDPVMLRVEWNQTTLDGNAALEITLSDNGPGLTPEAARRVFEPFFTTKTQGTGLGMAIVRRIIEAHRGRIEARTLETGTGTLVVIALPKGES